MSQATEYEGCVEVDLVKAELLKALEECTTENGAMAYLHHKVAVRRIEYINDIARAAIAKARGES